MTQSVNGGPYIGQRVVWLLDEDAGKRGTVIVPRAKISFSGVAKIVVQWDGRDSLSWIWPPNWGRSFGPLPVLDVLAEQGSAAQVEQKVEACLEASCPGHDVDLPEAHEEA